MSGTSGDIRIPEVFAAFYDETLPSIYGYLLRRSGGRVTIAEDLTSETYLRAIWKLRDGAVIDDPVRWLFGIARHILLDHYRSYERERERFLRLDSQVIQQPHERDGFTEVLERDYAMALLELLAPMQRIVIVLHYMDGLRVLEIAEAIGRSEHAVESLLARGRAAIKQFYKEADYEKA